jgi:hypothetical protein
MRGKPPRAPLVTFVIACLAGLSLGGPQAPAGAASHESVEWVVVPSPNTPDSDNFLKDVVAIAPDDAWAVGYHVNSDTQVYGSLAEHWDGTAWSIVSAPGLELNAVAATSSSDVWAVGGDYEGAKVYHWDGQNCNGVPQGFRARDPCWSVVFTVPHDEADGAALNDIGASSPTDVWAVGSVGLRTGSRRPLVVHGDGLTWQIVPAAEPPGEGWLSGVAAMSERNVWAVGTYATDHAHPLAEHWDGTQWRIVPTPDPSGPNVSNDLDDVVAASPDEVWALGKHVNFHSHDWRPFVIRWRHTVGHACGSARSNFGCWTEVPTPELECRNSMVSAAPITRQDIWAVGTESCSGDREVTLIEHWDGEQWQRVPSPNVGFLNLLSGVSASGPEDLWAVGYWYPINGGASTLILHGT